MKKKLLIGFSIVFAIIVIMIVLCFTLFAVSSATIDVRTSTDEHFPSQEQILESAVIPKGKPVFFINKKKIKNNIESQNPYVEVVNIETVFPNKLIVHVKERQEVYAFEFGEKTYLADNNLVVLREIESFDSQNDNPIFISGLDLQQDYILLGQKLESENYVDIFDALVACNRPLYMQKSMIKSIEFSQHEDINTKKITPCAYIHTFDGHEYRIFNTNKNLIYKMQKFLTAYSSLYDYIGKDILKDKNSAYIDEKWIGVKWTKEMLDKAYIVIDDRYKVVDKNSPCFANVVPAQEE